MKYRIVKICFLFMLLSFSCNRKDEAKENLDKSPPQTIKKHSKGFLNAFGKAKIGMSIKEFNKIFKENLKDTISTEYSGNLFHMGFKELDVEQNIKLKGVSVYFRHGKLRFIGCNLNENLIKQLNTKYGVDLMKKKYTNFTTDSINIDFEHNSMGMSISAIKFNI